MTNRLGIKLEFTIHGRINEYVLAVGVVCGPVHLLQRPRLKVPAKYTKGANSIECKNQDVREGVAKTRGVLEVAVRDAPGHVVDVTLQ